MTKNCYNRQLVTISVVTITEKHCTHFCNPQAQVVLDLATETLNWTTVDVLVSAEAAYSKSLKERLSDLISENKRNLTLCSIQE